MRINLAVSLALVLPMAALADVGGTTTLPSGQELNLSTGTTGNSGGDIQWTGSAIDFVGTAVGFDLPGNNAANFPSYMLTEAEADMVLMSSSPIPLGSLVVGNLFLMQTNSGSFAKLLVTAQSGTSITLQYDTFGITPTITAVLDAGSYTPNIAEGSVFVIKGTGLSSPGLTQPPFPLPTAIGGVSIAFTPALGGSPTLAFIDYLYNTGGMNQLAAILPSTLPVGFYNLTVTNNGVTSSPFPVTVVAQKPGLLTVDESGDGLAVAQNYISATELDLDRYTTGTVAGFTISPAHPGETLIAWATGFGAVPFADNMRARVDDPAIDVPSHEIAAQPVRRTRPGQRQRRICRQRVVNCDQRREKGGEQEDRHDHRSNRAQWVTACEKPDGAPSAFDIGPGSGQFAAVVDTAHVTPPVERNCSL